MPTVLVLVFLGTLCRLVPHPPNAVAVGAIALYAGARLPKRWAWAVPVAAMILADVVLDWSGARSWASPGRWIGYASYALIALAGTLARRSSNPIRLAGLAIGGSLFFFVTSNLATWWFGEGGMMYPHTYAGLVACFVAATPFLGTGSYTFLLNDVVANLAGTGLLFGFDALAHAIQARKSAGAAAAPLKDAPVNA